MLPAPGPTATFKPRDVEELIDYYFHRRAAGVLVRVLAPLPITPNQVTFASGAVALVAGGLIGWAGRDSRLILAGAAVFFLSVLLDCADGQLARLRQVSSLAGRALDGFVDVASVVAIFVGQFVWLHLAGYPPWLTLGLGWAAGLSLRWHAHRYDHVKNVYLHNVEGTKAGGASWLPSFEEIERERLEHAAAGRWFSALVLRGFAAFTRSQRSGIQGETGLDAPPARSDAERAAYRRCFSLYMRLWTFNGLGTHLFMLTVATALIPLAPTAPLWAWAIICGPMNLMTLGLERWRRVAERRLRHELAKLPAA
jgi:hypothetical protein